MSAQTTMTAPTVKVLYIAAHSRSGSTLLDRMLGQIGGYSSLGEVRHLWQRGIVEGQRCGCGAPFQECPFWTAVLTSAFGGMDLATGATMARQLRDVGHLWHIGRLRHARRSGTPDTEALASVTRTLADLYAGLQRTADSRVLVDSSKSPSYAYLLSLVPGLQLHIVHLVRDGRGVAYSRLRRKQRGELRDRSEALLVTRTAIEWAAVNGLSSSLRDSVPYSLVKYEEMIEDPAGVLRQIVATLWRPRSRSFVHAGSPGSPRAESHGVGQRDAVRAGLDRADPGRRMAPLAAEASPMGLELDYVAVDEALRIPMSGQWPL